MQKFPLKFEVSADAKLDICETWKVQSNALSPIECAIPPAFCGSGKGYTPEDFFALAILNCIIASFKVSCNKEKQSFEDVKAKAKLTLDIENNILTFTEIDITIDVSGSSDKDKVKEILEKSIKKCPVGNSIKTIKILHLNVE